MTVYTQNTSSQEEEVEKVQEVTLDVSRKKGRLSSHWKRLLNVGYAKSLSDGNIQKELRYLQKKIGFEYIRIKGVLDDDMCLLRFDMNGKTILNYACIDEGIDLILALGAKPALELGAMPGIMAENKDFFSMRGEVISVPSDLEKWKNLIRLFMEHLVKRYGRTQVSRWIFSPWISPDFIDLGMMDRESYISTYTASANIIREIVPNARLTGPGSVSFEICWPWFFSMCREHDCIPDIISFRSYAAVNEQKHSVQGRNGEYAFDFGGVE